jgi:hypothetical protein
MGIYAVISINISKAKAIAHDRRRTKREEEFAPHDAVIAKRIPGTAEADAEAARAVIRAKYAGVQAAIDAATTPSAIKAVLDSI